MGDHALFADPQTLTVNAVGTDLAAISRAALSSAYRDADGVYKLSISHTEGSKRDRRMVRVDWTKTTTDPFVDGNNVEVSMSAYLVLDHPVYGFSAAEKGYIISALCDWLADSTDIAQFVGGES